MKNKYHFLDRAIRDKEYEELLNSNVSVLKSIESSVCQGVCTFRDIIQNFPKFEEAEVVKGMKGWKHSEDKEKKLQYSTTKVKMPAFLLTTVIPAGTTPIGRKEIINPYIIIDIDDVEVNDETMEKLNSLPFVLGTGVSFGGDGYYSVVKFSSSVDNEEKFRQMFDQLVDEYEAIGIGIDKSCSNINRLRAYTPYEFCRSVNYEREFEPNLNVKKKSPIISEEDTLNLSKYQKTGSSSIPRRFQFLGERTEDYYREAPMPTMYYGEEGKNYELLWIYSNALYKHCGEDGYEILRNYFPTTEKKVLDGYWPTSRKNAKMDVRNFITKELMSLGIIEVDYDLDDF